MSDYDDLCASQEVHEVPVKLADGKERKLNFRELPATTYRKFQFMERSEDADERANSVAYLISESLCEKDGTQALSFEKACTLKPAPMNALFMAVLTANGMGERKNSSESEEKSGSGTSSLSPSEADPSASGSAS